jgi:acetyl-CoA acetyltransferase
MPGLRGAAAIVGIGETELGHLPGSNVMDLCAQSARLALDDAGMKKDDVDGLIVFGSRVEDHTRFQALVAEHLGMPLKHYTDVTKTGGASSASAVRTAASLIATDQCDNVLIVFADNLSSGLGTEGILPIFAAHHHTEFEMPFGPLIISLYALVARRMMAEYGWTEGQVAHAAVAARQWAALNPKASLRNPITVEEVLRSRMITSPLRRHDCGLISDGGTAVVVSRADRAKDFRTRPVYVLGAGSMFSYYYIHNLPDFTDYLIDMGAESAAVARRIARLDNSDIDMAFVGDPVTWCVPANLASCGFSTKKEAAAFVASGAIAPGGRLPVNTHGGNLACAHPGTPGQMMNVIEAVRQLRGQAGERQQRRAETAMIHGQAGVLTSHCTLVLGTESTL